MKNLNMTDAAHATRPHPCDGPLSTSRDRHSLRHSFWAEIRGPLLLPAVTALLVLVLVAGGVEAAAGTANPAARGTTYFVANDGDDDNLGTSSGAAWQTLAKVNSWSFLPGDSILLERGDEWYEPLVISWSGTVAEPILVGSYGTGEMPRILGSVRLTAWSHVTGSIWVSDDPATDPSMGAPHDGSAQGSGGWPGGAWFEELDGSVSWGHQEKVIDSAGDFSEFGEPYDWGWYGDHIYVYSTADPATTWAGVQASQRQYAVGMPGNNPAEHIVIDGLEMLFAQSKGFYGGYPAMEAHDLTIRNCHVGWIGIKSAASAYGLAVWHSDLLVQDNEIHDCGRRSVSYNVYATRGVIFENAIFEGNTFHHGFHTTGLDISNSGTDTFRNFTTRGNLFEGDPTVDLAAVPEEFNSNHIWTDAGSGVMTDFTFVNNIFTACHGKGLAVTGIDHALVAFNTFYGVNPTLANYQAQIYFSSDVTNAVVRNNVFYNDVDPSFNSYFMSVKADSDDLADIDMDFNLFHTSDPSAFIVDIVGISGSYTADEWGIYKSETGWDASSPAPADPLFVNAPLGDFHLSDGSAAIGAGEAVAGITTDYNGLLRDDPPSLGALRYLPGDLIFQDGFESGDQQAWN